MKNILSSLLSGALIATACLTANAADNQPRHIVKATSGYCDATVNQHRRTSLFPNVKTTAKLDTITCHADTGYDNDHDYGGKDMTKGDAQ